jgi:hypothetical protein
MTVQLPPELETQLAEKARAEGVSIEAFVERVVRDATRAGREPLRLPVWSGRVLSDLRREDLYDDVR